MKKVIFIVFSILLIINICGCKKEKNTIIDNSMDDYKEPTEEEVIEFCRKYYIDSSLAHAKSLKIYDIEDLDDYYINHEVETGPSPSDTSSIYVKSDDFNLIEVEKESIHRITRIDGREELIYGSYTVYYHYNYYGSLKEPVNGQQRKSGFSVYAYRDKLKIYIDPSLIRLTIRQSDIPIALQSLAEGKTIQER